MKPLGDSIAIDPRRTRLHVVPKTLQELAERTAAIAVAMLAQHGYVFGPGRTLDVALPTPEELRRQMQEAGLWRNRRDEVERSFHHGRIRVRYPGGPVLAPGGQSQVTVTLTNDTERRMEGPVAVAPLAPGLSAGIAPEAVDLLPGESAELTVELSLDAAATPRAHSDITIAVLAEDRPWSFTVSVIRPMCWQMERWPARRQAPRRGSIPSSGAWRSRNRVRCQSRDVGGSDARAESLGMRRPVRICSPSNTLTVCEW